VFAALDAWSMQTGAGQVSLAPGVIFAADDDVASDVVWVSSERLTVTPGEVGHLHATPEGG
jgi:hypothetical protein